MKLAILQENLKTALAIAGQAVSTRGSLPVLSNIALEADAAENRLRLSAMDLEISIVCYTGALVEESGGVTLPARLLKDLVAALPKERIDMELDGSRQTMRVRCARTDAKVKGIDLAEFPALPSPQGAPTLVLTVGEMRHLIKSVIHAAAKEEARPALTGVNLRLANQRLEAAATDGFRLAVCELAVESEGTATALVPARALAVLQSVMATEEEDESVHLFFDNEKPQVFFVLPGVTVAAQKIEANYPAYEKIIPPSYKARYEVDAAGMLRALKTVTLFEGPVTLSALEVAIGAELHVLATDADGDARVVIDIEGVQGDVKDGEIGPVMAVNGRYLADALAALDAPVVAIETTTAGRPLALRPVGENRVGDVQVAMPMSGEAGNGK